MAAGQVDDLKAGIQRASEAIDSGAALGKLDALILYSRSLQPS